MSHLSKKDAHLYNQDRPSSRPKGKPISSASSIALSSTLSSLIKTASSDASKPAAGRARSTKEDIFKSHNKGVNKRAAKDLEDSQFTQKHRKLTSDEKAEDEAHWKRAKRRMEEKARLYNALKRGDIEDVDDKYGVDFDAKWAEQQEKGGAGADSSSSESEASDEELVEYQDEFGRTRKGTRAEMAREERRKRTLAADEPDRFTARPSMPTNIIYGDAVQSQAFNPDETIAQQMAELAAKRDKELTPPPDEHFDGRQEVRQRGTAFMHFSKDEEERRKQMSNLEKERQETERARRERKEQIEKRKEMIKEKKRAIQEKKAKGQADRFLNELGAELFGERKEEGDEKGA
ncbi:uncharacterized protein CC84DRAFT_1162100 [Paraphaeosphaeria sporulosa]|uniref:Uncharacterized protein n=1 Tax=Paraphaeosphaeria sporulosa TaxID=1460663 RepID=A0A177CLI3_9PLEO|nr:uncharacterized protein CC84DRAFT_1162100 [Paraphaeosphaeria sporulosa]OAG08101.1 hypothetical protein CC84DRAFT_1162100 [Paraphaeosphaeria sporulosa]